MAIFNSYVSLPEGTPTYPRVYEMAIWRVFFIPHFQTQPHACHDSSQFWPFPSSNIIQRCAPAPSPVMFEVEAQDLQPKRCGRCTIGFIIEADSKTPGTEKGAFVSPTRT